MPTLKEDFKKVYRDLASFIASRGGKQLQEANLSTSAWKILLRSKMSSFLVEKSFLGQCNYSAMKPKVCHLIVATARHVKAKFIIQTFQSAQKFKKWTKREPYGVIPLAWMSNLDAEGPFPSINHHLLLKFHVLWTKFDVENQWSDVKIGERKVKIGEEK